MEHRTHSPVRLTLFSVDEANRVANEIRPDLQRLARMKLDLDRVASRLEVLKIVTEGVSDDNPDTRELVALGERLGQLRQQIAVGIEGIHRRGCLVKDVEKGLVDFYGLSGDRLIFLCWQMDEAEVGHWHPLAGGFAARRPLGSDSE